MFTTPSCRLDKKNGSIPETVQVAPLKKLLWLVIHRHVDQIVIGVDADEIRLQ